MINFLVALEQCRQVNICQQIFLYELKPLQRLKLSIRDN